MNQPQPMTVASVRELLETAGARVMARDGRSENYSAPREFSFEAKALFPNGLGVHIVARQFNYRDPWEAQGRVNDLVDVALLRDNQPSQLPKGYQWFQGHEEEAGVDEIGLREIIVCIKDLNPKLFLLQELTGDF